MAQEKTNVRYLYTWCNNHMDINKNRFMKIDESVRRSIRGVNNRMVTLEGMGKLLLKKKDEKMLSYMMYCMFLI